MKSYAIVGVGSRAKTFYDAICNRYSENSKIVAVCDTNPARLDWAAQNIHNTFKDCKKYTANQFDKMLDETRPDVVLVCCIDREHDHYICRSLEKGSDVITEKPMTIDEARCQKIIDTVAKTNKQVRVAFNYRYSPARMKVKELLMQGTIGKIISVSFQWNLDLSHGADYFRRWHRNKENSGGLLVHKSTHHFDLVNWFLGSMPKSVYANGGRDFYTPQQAKRYGLDNRGPRCLKCAQKHICNFCLDISKFSDMRNLYLNAEKHDGYCRDKCVFDDDIDIEDNLSVTVEYQNNAVLTYCLNAFQPWEGYRLEINGTKGRLEHNCRESSYINGDGTTQGGFEAEGTDIIIYPHFKTPYDVEIEKATGGHGGGDDRLVEDLFGQIKEDKFGRAADYVQGAASILVGIAGNKSINSKKVIFIDDLVKNLPDPEYKQNKGEDEHIEFVEDVKYQHAMANEEG
jgi:predicted dehydrogenase